MSFFKKVPDRKIHIFEIDFLKVPGPEILQIY